MICIFLSPLHSTALVQMSCKLLLLLIEAAHAGQHHNVSNVCPRHFLKQKETKKKCYIKSTKIKPEKLTENALYCDNKALNIQYFPIFGKLHLLLFLKQIT